MTENALQHDTDCDGDCTVIETDCCDRTVAGCLCEVDISDAAISGDVVVSCKHGAGCQSR